MTPHPTNDPGYRELLAWLFAQRRDAPRDPGRMRPLLERLGIAPSVPSVHVVGTVGKGTVAAMIERGLRADGAITGRFLSPHIEDVRERVEVAGEPIPADELAAFVDRVRALELTPKPAFFEICFALALDAFARRGVQVAVMEAGVGARGDATAALREVVLTVLTNVSTDHAATIGPTVADIAHDKAAAIRPGVPVVTGATGVARAIVVARAARVGAPLWADPPGGDAFAVPASDVARGDLARMANQRLAAAALRVLHASEAAVSAGVTAEPLPARRERFTVDGRTVILDAAHNPSGAASLAASLERGYVLVFGALARKDGARTLRALAGPARRVVLTEAADGDGVSVAWPDADVIANPEDALRHALASCPPRGTVVVAGSMYLAGRVRPWLRSRAGAATSTMAPR